jgi:hypothetical protein
MRKQRRFAFMTYLLNVLAIRGDKSPGSFPQEA